MAAAIASGLIRQKRQAREQHAHRPTAHRRRKSPGKKQGLCNGNLVDIFSKVRIFGLKKRRLRRQGVEEGGLHMHAHIHTVAGTQTYWYARARALLHTHAGMHFYARPHFVHNLLHVHALAGWGTRIRTSTRTRKHPEHAKIHTARLSPSLPLSLYPPSLFPLCSVTHTRAHCHALLCPMVQ